MHLLVSSGRWGRTVRPCLERKSHGNRGYPYLFCVVCNTVEMISFMYSPLYLWRESLQNATVRDGIAKVNQSGHSEGIRGPGERHDNSTDVEKGELIERTRAHSRLLDGAWDVGSQFLHDGLLLDSMGTCWSRCDIYQSRRASYRTSAIAAASVKSEKWKVCRKGFPVLMRKRSKYTKS